MPEVGPAPQELWLGDLELLGALGLPCERLHLRVKNSLDAPRAVREALLQRCRTACFHAFNLRLLEAQDTLGEALGVTHEVAGELGHAPGHRGIGVGESGFQPPEKLSPVLIRPQGQEVDVHIARQPAPLLAALFHGEHRGLLGGGPEDEACAQARLLADLTEHLHLVVHGRGRELAVATDKDHDPRARLPDGAEGHAGVDLEIHVGRVRPMQLRLMYLELAGLPELLEGSVEHYGASASVERYGANELFGLVNGGGFCAGAPPRPEGGGRGGGRSAEALGGHEAPLDQHHTAPGLVVARL
mmetsp:Transcript_51910/g.166188  ORF Transcript_51910/g.166188 Transcript_51910/m.166188 type:complete len:301 (-) Transcript_51910:915-1817(-)